MAGGGRGGRKGSEMAGRVMPPAIVFGDALNVTTLRNFDNINTCLIITQF